MIPILILTFLAAAQTAPAGESPWPTQMEGVRIVLETDPAPKCEVVKRRIKVVSPVSKADALRMLAEAAKARGADTVRLTAVPYMWEFKNPPRRKVTAVGRAYRCGTAAAEEGKP